MWVLVNDKMLLDSGAVGTLFLLPRNGRGRAGMGYGHP